MKHCVVSKSGKHKYGVTISLNKCLYCSLQAEAKKNIQTDFVDCKNGEHCHCHHINSEITMFCTQDITHCEHCSPTPKEGWEEKKIEEFREEFKNFLCSIHPSHCVKLEAFLLQAIKDAREEK